jgi:hypothetical protein
LVGLARRRRGRGHVLCLGIKERESLLRECIRYHRTRDASRIDLSREAKGESEMIVENCGDERWLIGAR